MCPTQTTIARSSRWLNEFAANVTSQSGEDGIIEKVLELIPARNAWCVEFGAWDGRQYSNTYNLFTHKDYAAVLIEGNIDRFAQLQRNVADNPRVIPVHAYVGFEAADGLDNILRQTPIPREFDLLAIDIDGNDYHVWDALSYYCPKVVVIEYNPTIPNAVDFVQPRDMRVNQGSSIAAIVRLAVSKGYELVAVTALNAVFVETAYFPNFNIADNRLGTMRPAEPLVTYVFNGYDGTVFIRGYGKLGWHGVPYLEQRIQQLPRWLRQYPKHYGKPKRLLAKLYRSWRKRQAG